MSNSTVSCQLAKPNTRVLNVLLHGHLMDFVSLDGTTVHVVDISNRHAVPTILKQEDTVHGLAPVPETLSLFSGSAKTIRFACRTQELLQRLVGLSEGSVQVWRHADLDSQPITVRGSAAGCPRLLFNHVVVGNNFKREDEMYPLAEKTEPTRLMRFRSACIDLYLSGDKIFIATNVNETFEIRKLVETEDSEYFSLWIILVTWEPRILQSADLIPPFLLRITKVRFMPLKSQLIGFKIFYTYLSLICCGSSLSLHGILKRAQECESGRTENLFSEDFGARRRIPI